MDPGATAPKPHVAIRRRRLQSVVDLASGVVLEIGALDSPIAVSPPCEVRYVDVLDREGLRAYYGHDPDVDLDRIVDVDFPLRHGDRLRTLAEAAAPGAPYRWAVASHVVEHVPDLIGWLADVAELLEDDGGLVVVVPDRRFTFDAARPPTTVGQLLQAHTLREAVPSERAVYDHFRSVVHVPSSTLWSGAPPGDVPPTFDIETAASMREAALRGEYVDSHVWVFTPRELVAQLDDLGDLGLCELEVEHVLTTPRDELEFIVVLRRLPRVAGAERRAELRRARVVQDPDGSWGAPHPRRHARRGGTGDGGERSRTAADPGQAGGASACARAGDPGRRARRRPARRHTREAQRSGSRGTSSRGVTPVAICSASSDPVSGPRVTPHIPWPPAT